MTVRRIDFKHVRQHADFVRVLDAYDIDTIKDGSRPGQFKALCPFHDDTKPSLKVNTEKNVFHCFACEAKGNVIDFVMQMDGVEIRPAAKTVAELSDIDPAPGRAADNAKTSKSHSKRPAPRRQATPETPAGDTEEPDATAQNPKLSFELKLTQPPDLVSWLETRGIDESTARIFGLGQVSARSKTIGGRLAIPLHNGSGELIGYCGRSIGDDVPDGTPKYILPKGFHKDREVFNLHRVADDSEYVVLFESYFSVMRHHAHVKAVSAFGRAISEQQIAVLQDAGCRRVLIAFDGDQPGRDGANQAAGLLANRFWVKSIQLPDGTKPHHLDWATLAPILRSAW